MSACDGVTAVVESRSADQVLTRIAAMIGCPVEALTGDAAGGHIAETADLLRLWLAIGSPEDRRKLLDFTRELAGPDLEP